MPIDPEVVAALRTLAAVLARENRTFVIIGATVPQLLVDLTPGLEGLARATRDVDALVTAGSWEEFARIRSRLFEAGFRAGPAPHELVFGRDVKMDLIPYGPGIVQNDRLLWPGEDRVMSTLGIAEAFESATEVKVESGLSLRVVPIPGLVLLKVIAYQDRPAERARDLTDVIHVFEQYEAAIEGSRRFDLTGKIVNEQPVQFEEAGAYLLGLEIARLAKPHSLTAVRRLLGTITDEYSKPVSQILLEERRIPDNEGRGRRLVRLFRVFAAGLEEGARSAPGSPSSSKS